MLKVTFPFFVISRIPEKCALLCKYLALISAVDKAKKTMV